MLSNLPEHTGFVAIIKVYRASKGPKPYLFYC